VDLDPRISKPFVPLSQAGKCRGPLRLRWWQLLELARTHTRCGECWYFQC